MKLIQLLIFSLGFIQSPLFSQTGITGRVQDENGVSISNANISIENSKTGSVTDAEGYFNLKLDNGKYLVKISSIGFETYSTKINLVSEFKDLGTITLLSKFEIMDEVVISGSRKLEKITKSPAAINLITAAQMSNFVGSPEELFALQKGVDFTRAGSFWGSISIRGFNSAFNQKMLLLDDNRIAHTRIRTPVGPLSAFVKEDIERVEIVLGPSSALYGPNSLNGLFNTISKSPFKYPGTTVVVGSGSNNLFNTRFRHANKLSEKWAYKVTGEYISGEENKFTDSVYVATSTPGVFEGKTEIGLDRDVSFVKGLAAVFYKPNETSEIGLNYAINLSNSKNSGNNNLNGWNKSSLQATYKSKHWFGQVYKTWIIMDESINTQTRSTNYYALLSLGQSEEAAFNNSLSSPRPARIEEDTYRHKGKFNITMPGVI